MVSTINIQRARQTANTTTWHSPSIEKEDNPKERKSKVSPTSKTRQMQMPSGRNRRNNRRTSFRLGEVEDSTIQNLGAGTRYQGRMPESIQEISGRLFMEVTLGTQEKHQAK